MRLRLLAAFLLFSVAGWSQSFFIQGSDPQFGMFAKDQNFVQETANYEFFIANVNRLKPAFVIICGDLTNANSPSQIAEYKRIGAKLDPSITLYSVAGNHDVGNEPTPDLVASFRKNYGPDYYSFQNAGIYGIVLDSSVLAHPQKAGDEPEKQERWLRAELVKAKGSGQTIVIFQHHPWFLERADEPDQYFNVPLAIRGTYLKLFEDYGVRYLFAGHYHRNATAQTPAFQMLTTGPIGMPVGPDPSGFRIVKITKSGLEQGYVGLGAIPNRVSN